MSIAIFRLAFILTGFIPVLLAVLLPRWRPVFKKLSWLFLGFFIFLNIGFNVFLWFNHINFPLNLDLMEGTLLQEFQRAASGQYIYPEPNPSYVPMDYNPLYYFLSVPFGWIFGVNLFTMRLVSILGMAGSGLILYLVVRKRTGSVGWGIVAAGLFAAAYRVMDAYLDSAHSDSWLLCSALFGSYLLDNKGSKKNNVLGVIVLASSFWFKQHGALFAIGGLFYLTYREGAKNSLLYWGLAGILGPALYFVAGPLLFGSHFHYFTLEVPRQWSSHLGLGTFRRFLYFIARYYPVLAMSGAWLIARDFFADSKKLSVWHIQFIFAMLTGLMGSLRRGIVG